MQIKRIKCPNCQAILDVKNSKNEAIKQITCPSCNVLLKVKFDVQQDSDEPIEAHTYYAAPDNGKTQLQVADKKTTTQVTLEFENYLYNLEEGQNIIGRKGNTSKATIQIATDDRFMSRQHCAIKISTLPDGSQKAVLSNYQNKNLTMVNGQEVESGDEIRLTNGNLITMGHTTVTFKLS